MGWRCLDYSIDKTNSKLERLSAILGGVRQMVIIEVCVLMLFRRSDNLYKEYLLRILTCHPPEEYQFLGTNV